MSTYSTVIIQEFENWETLKLIKVNIHSNENSASRNEMLLFWDFLQQIVYLQLSCFHLKISFCTCFPFKLSMFDFIWLNYKQKSFHS